MASLFRPVSTATRFTRQFSVSAARSDLNKVQLIGRVGIDPSTNEIGNDRRVVKYTLATSETKPDREGNLIKRTQWHRIVSWYAAEWLPNKIKKGDLVYVEGQLRYSDYTDKDGVQRTMAEIHQTHCKLLNNTRANMVDEE
ncbi:hypothetical protein DFQ28_010750 [Apophysomyces sp. BC1034]|nr:hypothetical protein DFQ30_010434 [Apophysomyces sp. BC1015]KAG0170464.1 hypothetical protein DFQ29_009229 [Apophysomyces sp. BC1021]KAG0184668.1 hypothetical protein DFQ28_010750 [Apophysomyces sp. BC1034]